MSYELILEAARSRDIAALTDVLKRTTIDVWKPGQIHYSAISQLVQEKDKKAVDFLLEQGASLHYAALGAALSGEHAYCKALVERGASLHYVAEGAAMGGYRAYCEELIALKAWLIFYVATGAAMGGDRAYCEELIVRKADLINYVAKGAARCGNHAYCNELIQRGANPNYAVQGAAEGRHHRYCEELLTAGANIEIAAMGAASGGDPVYCDMLINRASEDGNRDYCLRRAAYGAMQGGHYTYFESLIRQLTKRGVGLQDVAHELARSRIFETEAATFYFLLHFENASFRNALITTLPASVTVLSENLAATGSMDIPVWSLQPSPLSEEIKKFLPRAKKQLEGIFYFRNKYDLSLHQARVMWEKWGLLSLWILQIMPQLLYSDEKSKRPALNADVLFHITRYLFPALTGRTFNDLSFKVIRHFLVASMDDYISFTNPVFRVLNWLNLKKTPQRLHLARAQSFQEEVKLTQSKKELARLCIEQSALFNKNNLTDEKGCTTLFYAVNNSMEAKDVKPLLDNGAAPNSARKSDGETPLHLAVRQGNVKMVELLMVYGANPNQRNKKNETAYDITKQLDQDVAEKIVSILGRPEQPSILPAHQQAVNCGEENDPFVEMLELTCTRLVM